jgi:hypothetical protein
MAKGYRRANYIEQRKMEEILRNVLVKTDKEGVWLYKDGWDDNRVAKEVNKEFTESHVHTVRRAMFGSLYRGEVEVGSKFHDIVRRLMQVEKKLATQDIMIKKLMDDLGVKDMHEF